MNGADFAAALQQRLGARTDITTSVMSVEVNMVQTNILEKAAFKPWFLQKEDTTIVTTINQEWVNQPTDFLEFDPDDEWSGVDYLSPTDTSADPYHPIIIDDFKVIKARFKDNVVGSPQKAGLVGTRLYLRPIPDLVYGLRWRYYARDAAVVYDTTANLWLTHAADWLMGEVGFVLSSQYTKSTEDAAVFATMRDAGRRRVYNETIARMEAGKARQQGDD